MKAILALFVSLVVLSVVAHSDAAEAHPMTSKMLSAFARGFYGDEVGKEMVLNGRMPCIGCTLGTYLPIFTAFTAYRAQTSSNSPSKSGEPIP